MILYHIKCEKQAKTRIIEFRDTLKVYIKFIQSLCKVHVNSIQSLWEVCTKHQVNLLTRSFRLSFLCCKAESRVWVHLSSPKLRSLT